VFNEGEIEKKETVAFEKEPTNLNLTVSLKNIGKV
jgi:hypothetical protein